MECDSVCCLSTSLYRLLGHLRGTRIVNKLWSQKRDHWYCWKPISSLSMLNNVADNRKRTSFLACHPIILHMHTFDMNPQSVTVVVWSRVFSVFYYTIVIPIFCALTCSHFVYVISQQSFWERPQRQVQKYTRELCFVCLSASKNSINAQSIFMKFDIGQTSDVCRHIPNVMKIRQNNGHYCMENHNFFALA